ncbi:glycosyltransferase [Vibrio paracholerae]|uniref:glycosyltransferase n=1 Tax=Vibrio paracholerae TaxID=650003 RepID=UPI0020952876|nr:glycosyltransferase [Vibrio paracholerae]MCO7016133.1 glycosyltransferase [Vibrio paracholerae]
MLNKLKLSYRHKKNIKKIATSEYFDAEFYCERYKDVLSSNFTPAEHYYSIGWKERRNPSLKFDTCFYLEDNKDVKDAGINPLLHFILSGKDEKRACLPVVRHELSFISTQLDKMDGVQDKAQAELSSVHKLLKDSELFCPEYYRHHYPDVSGCPISHYIDHGWKERRNPSHLFNTGYYLDENPDVLKSGVNPLEHWILYGQGEGRKTRVKFVEPVLMTKKNNPSIIFVSHEASETGAPAVLLSLMGWVKRNTNINFSIVVGASGPWDNKFVELAPTFFFDKPHSEDDIKEFCGDHVQAVYVNTIASANYAKALDFLHAEFITHVHEMENVFKIFEEHVLTLKDICNKYIAVSPGSIESINKRLPDVEIKYLKPFINEYQKNEDVIVESDKKIIFGCGAVEIRKGFDVFCDVASRLKKDGLDNVEMHWIGSDVNKDLNASEVIEKYDVADVVKFLGPKANPRDYFKNGFLFLLTSREDPYPLVCMEAAEFGLPVICFDEQAGGMHTFVENDAGVVVPYLDIANMSQAVTDLLNNSSKVKKLGLKAKEKVAERHYVDVIAPQILDYIPDVAKSEGKNKIDSYKELINKSKVVSFDIFDTLVVRELAAPEVVFDIAEYQHTKNEAGILSLFEERMKTAGKVLGSYKGKVDDISIDEIYEQMPLYRNSKIEKDSEVSVCITHPIGKSLYDYAYSLGKKIFITSDMYLDRKTIENILVKNGYHHWDELFLSSERGKKKDTGKLFEDLKSYAKKLNVESDEILHIGDNWIGDIKWARKSRINAVRFTPVYESDSKLITFNSEQQLKLSQAGRIWDSFSTQSAKLWTEANPDLASDFYIKLGFELTGPLASMMAMHTKQLADAENVTKIIFMARDGRIIKKAFDTLYAHDIASGKYESQYLHLSRATVVAATFEPELTSNDLYFLIEGLHLAEKDIAYFLSKANLNIQDKAIVNKVMKYFETIDYVPSWNDFSQLSALLESLSKEIYDANESQRKGLACYLKEHGIFDANKVMVVDVGWLLNIQSRLVRFIKNYSSKTQLVGSYVGTRERINKSLKHASLLYNFGEPSLYSKFLEDNVTLFEVLFSSPEPSAAAILEVEGKAELILKPLGMPLPKEYIVAQKLHMGAEAYFEKLANAQNVYLPQIVSTDYFFTIFEALVNSNHDIAKAELGNFEVRLGGHHEFTANQNLIKNNSFVDYKIKAPDEYFEPIHYQVDNPVKCQVIVTSAGLTNGSTRYRSLNLAESLQFRGVQSVVIHSQTALEVAEKFIKASDTIIFQRCFSQQGNVGEFLALARKHQLECVGEMDDLVFPEHIETIGSVKGGEWDVAQAMFVAKSYEAFIKQMDSCIVSTAALKEYIEDTYGLACRIEPNKISHNKIRKPTEKSGPLKIIYASGTYSHKEDFELIEAPLFEFLSNNSDVRLSILGATQSSERILALPNVSSYPLLPYDAMLDFVAKHDVMLVPLVDDIFNNAKSNVKFVEAGAVGVPVIASNVREYYNSIEIGVNGFVVNDNTDFFTKLSEIEDRKKCISELVDNIYLSIDRKWSTKS